MKKTLLIALALFSLPLNTYAGRRNKEHHVPALSFKKTEPSATQEFTLTISTPPASTPKEPTPCSSACFFTNQDAETLLDQTSNKSENPDLFANNLSPIDQTTSDTHPKEEDLLIDEPLVSSFKYMSEPSTTATSQKKARGRRTEFCFFESDEDTGSDLERETLSSQPNSILEQFKTAAHKKVSQLIKPELDVLLEHDNTGKIETLFESFNNNSEQISNFIFHASSQAIKRKNLSEITTVARFIKRHNLKPYITPKQSSDFNLSLSACHEMIKLKAYFEDPADTDTTNSPRAITTSKCLQTLASQYGSKLSSEQITTLIQFIKNEPTAGQE